MSSTAPRPLSIEKRTRGTEGYRPQERWTVSDAVFSIVALIFCFLVTETIWTLVVHPRADAILAAPEVVTNADKSQHAVRKLRSPSVILRDREQQTAITLTLWSFILLIRQGLTVRRSRLQLASDFLQSDDERVILPEDVRTYSRAIDELPDSERDMLLPRLLTIALSRFGATRSVQDAADSVRDECEFEVASFEAKLSMVRYTAWAIPAVGFVGTVRGIGAALQEAQGAMTGDISGVTLGLGVAFNSTLIALICCIFVMFALHQLQQAQDRVILDSRTYTERKLLRRMRVM